MADPPGKPTSDDPGELALGQTLPASPRSSPATSRAPRGEPLPITVGARLGDRYQVTRLLGQGGMGAVYLADDEVLGKAVALKVVHRDLAGGTGGIEKLRDEVLLAQKVTHPNVCRTYDLEEVDGHYLIKMEFVAGEMLADRIKREDHIALPDALAIARAIATGLAAAHEQGVIHRDLKPQNVLLEAKTGRVVLMDFGIARTAAGDGVDDAERRPVGTPEYMAPEQARAQEVDGRTDLYALGCVLYHMLIGEVPFPASTPMAAVVRHIMDPPPDPRAVRHDLPPWVAKVIARLLEKEPARRLPDAAAVLRALDGPRPHRWRRTLGLAALAAVATVAATLGWHLHFAVSTIDCAGFALRRQVMECLGPVAAAAQHPRAATFRFHRRAGRVLRVERMSGAGHLADDDEGQAAWEYVYDEHGAVKETVARDRRGRTVVRLIHSDDLRRTDRRDALNNPLPEADTDVTVHLNEFDPQGRLVRERFANVYGSPRPDRFGAFGWALTTDERGTISRLDALGSSGTAAPTAGGLARIALDHDALANPAEERYLGPDGKPVLIRDGYAVVRRTFDRVGNRHEEAYLGVDGKPAFCADGYASLRNVYGARGDKIQISYFGTDGTPALTRGGYATLRMRHDERGERIEESSFGIYGEPTLNHEGFATVRATHEPGLIEEAYFDAKGKPAPTRGGYARFRERFDEGRRPIEESYLGVDGAKALTRDGFATRRTRYDERGRPVEEGYLGTDGRPTLRRGGYASRRLAYDERGRLGEEVYLGVDGKPILRREGYASVRMKYDEQGNRVETAYFGVDGRPVLHPGGFAVMRARFDPRGDRLEESFLGVGGERVVAKSGYARVTVRYDERGRVIEEELFDAADHRALGQGGYAIRRARYDRGGHLVEEGYFGAQDTPIAGRAGFATWRAVYDDRGDRVEERFFDAAGRPVLGPAGAALVRSEWNGRGQRVLEQLFGVDGERRVGLLGWHAQRSKHDPWGRPTDIAWLGADAQPQPVITRDGAAQLRIRYDEQGRPVQRTFLGPGGKKALGRAGYVTVVATYDRWGNRVEERFFGEGDQPILSSEGSAGRRTVFDGDGQEVRRVDFDLRGEAIAGVGRQLAWTVEKGQPVLLGSDGKPLADPALRARLAPRVEAHRAGFAAEGLRTRNPSLFAIDGHEARGVLIVEAAAASLVRAGDLVLAYDGRRLDRPDDLVAAIGNCDHPANVQLLRAGVPATIEVPPGKLDATLEPE